MNLAAPLLSILSALAPQEPPPPEANASARALGACRSLAVVADVGGHVSVAPDGSRVGAVDHGAGVARVIDATNGEVASLGEPGTVRSLALGSARTGLCLGRADGVVRVIDGDGAHRDLVVLEGRSVDGVMRAGALLAWSSSAADRGGVVDLRTGAPLATFDAPFGDYRLPRVWLSRDARHVMRFAADQEKGGRRVLVVHDVGTGERVAELATYASKRDCGVVFGVGCLLTAERAASSRWQLRRLDLVTLEQRVVDEDLRGGHFVDLFLSPNGRYLLEGDFEERGAVLYALGADGREARQQTLGGEGVLPVGFLPSDGARGDLALTTCERRRGLRAWSVATGEVVHASVAPVVDRQVTRAGALRGGRAIWVHWWRARDGAAVHHLEVITVGE